MPLENANAKTVELPYLEILVNMLKSHNDHTQGRLYSIAQRVAKLNSIVDELEIKLPEEEPLRASNISVLQVLKDEISRVELNEKWLSWIDDQLRSVF